jgi:hypothetical protein
MELKAGDVLIQGDQGRMGGFHALMWIGGEKPLVHSSNDTFLGILAQSMDYIGKSLGAPFERKEAKVAQTDTGVYRYAGTTEGMAEKAAYFASLWATEAKHVDPSVLDSIKKAREEKRPTPQAVLRTPFSSRRLNAAHDRRAGQAGHPVSIEVVFRVVKALARAQLNVSLSPNHGVSCSQFAVYCYQAASLSLKFGGALPGNVVKVFLKESNKQQESPPARLARYGEFDNQAKEKEYWRNVVWWTEQGMFRKARDLALDDEAVSLINTALKYDQTTDFYKNLLPVGMDIDPLSYGVQYLLTQLKNPGSSFRYQGHLTAARAESDTVAWTIEPPVGDNVRR